MEHKNAAKKVLIFATAKTPKNYVMVEILDFSESGLPKSRGVFSRGGVFSRYRPADNLIIGKYIKTTKN